MLQELFFALLGFTGDVIVESENTFKVKDGCDLFKETEILQINTLSSLGWFYTQFGDIVGKYDISWKLSDKSHLQVYKVAMSLGMSDLLTEYVNDVTYLEQLVLSDGPLPLSNVLQHLQKYMLVFPRLYAMLQNIEEKGLHGCQILEFFASYSSGVPLVTDVVNRILLRLRVVFVKQCFSWMLHGELEDYTGEFFVTAHLPPASETSAKQSSLSGVGATGDAKKGFNWVSSYTLCTANIPTTVISMRLAAKVLFAGKAVKLLQSSLDDLSNFKTLHTDVQRYLSTRSLVTTGDSGEEVEEVGDSSVHSSAPPLLSTSASATSSGRDVETETLQSALLNHLESCGYSAADMARFSEQFSHVLEQPDNAVELLETAIDDVNDTISNRLWQLLRDRLGFVPYLQVIRNTYLLGKGELFQCLLDQVLLHTASAQSQSASSSSSLEMDNMLNWKILRTTAKLLALDEGELLATMRLRVSNVSRFMVSDFRAHLQLGDVTITGQAELVAEATTGLTQTTPRVVVCLCGGKNTVNISSSSTDLTTAKDLWMPSLLRLSSNTVHATNTSKMPVGTTAAAEMGGLWFSDHKHIAKGFSLRTEVLPDWLQQGTENATRVQSGEIGETVVEGGSLSVCVRGDRRGLDAIGLDGDTASSLAVDVHFREVFSSRGVSIGRFATLVIRINEPTSVSSAGFADEWSSRNAVSSSSPTVEIPLGRDLAPLSLQVEYLREMASSTSVASSAVRGSLDSGMASRAGLAGSSSSSAVVFKLRVRLVPSEDIGREEETDPDLWHTQLTVDICKRIKHHSGHAFVGIIGRGGTVLSSGEHVLRLDIRSVSFHSRGTLTTYPVASAFTAARFPDTCARLDAEVSQIRAWMGLRLQLTFPPLFQIVFDAEAVAGYERLFSSIVRVRMIALLLEKLWIARSGRLGVDRVCCHLRHAMHFFCSNLLYYLQVDVVDSEFCALQEEVNTATDFRTVLQAHRGFLATVLRLSLVDNLSLQEAVEKVLHICLRFVAVCRLQQQADEDLTAEIFVPSEEMVAIRRDFFAQVTVLFTIMRNVDSRGFMFRLDFNGFLSTMAAGGSD